MNNKRPIISILVVSIDYKLNYHVDKVDNIIIPNPELRIFGSNSSGQRVCCHISGVSSSNCILSNLIYIDIIIYFIIYRCYHTFILDLLN